MSEDRALFAPHGDGADGQGSFDAISVERDEREHRSDRAGEAVRGHRPAGRSRRGCRAARGAPGGQYRARALGSGRPRYRAGWRGHVGGRWHRGGRGRRSPPATTPGARRRARQGEGPHLAEDAMREGAALGAEYVAARGGRKRAGRHEVRTRAGAGRPRSRGGARAPSPCPIPRPAPRRLGRATPPCGPARRRPACARP